MNNIRLAVSIALLGAWNLAFDMAQATEVGQYAFLGAEDDLYDFYGGADFVSIATGSKQPIHKAPAVASIITRDDIERLGARHLDEVLATIPGLHVTVSNLSRLDPVYSMRGIQTGFNPQILVLVNGTEFKNSFSGGLPFTFRMPTTHIERIEIIRGPGSALYGADAYSGVVNVITRPAQQGNVRSGARAGSFGTMDAWLQANRQSGNTTFQFAIESQRSDGDANRIATSDLQSMLDAVLGTSASLAPGPLETRYDILNIAASIHQGNLSWDNWYWQQRDGGIGPGGAQALDSVGRQNADLLRSKLGYEYALSAHLHAISDVSWMRMNNDSFFVLLPAGTVLPLGSDGNINFTDVAGVTLFTEGYIGNPISRHDDIRANLAFTYSGHTGHDIRIQFGWFEQRLTAREFKNFGPGITDGSAAMLDGQLTDVSGTPWIYIPDVSRTNHHITLQDTWRFANNWELTFGVRYDNFSDFGSTVNPRLSLVWDTAHNLTSKFLYGSAFRAPSFNELFLKNNPAALGNPELEPETIDTLELAFDYRPTFNSRFAANFYHYRARNMIDVAPVAGTTSLQTTNLNSQEGSGLELEYQWKNETGWQLSSNIAWQNAKNANTDKRIALVPQFSGYFDLTRTFNPQWDLTAQLFWIAGRSRETTDPRSRISDYQLLHLSSRYRFANTSWSLQASIRNLLDKAVYEPSNGSIGNDYRMEGRSIWLGAEYQF